MPRLPKGNQNPVVGTFDCPECHTVASVLMIQKERRRGTLYVRCGCGCDQRTGKHIQDKWRAMMTPKPGYEWVAQGKKPAPVPKPPGEDWTPGEPTTPPEPAPAAPEPAPEPSRRDKLREALKTL